MLAHVYQRVDYLILADLADRHAAGEYKSAAVSAGNAEVGLIHEAKVVREARRGGVRRFDKLSANGGSWGR